MGRRPTKGRGKRHNKRKKKTRRLTPEQKALKALAWLLEHDQFHWH